MVGMVKMVVKISSEHCLVTGSNYVVSVTCIGGK